MAGGWDARVTAPRHTSASTARPPPESGTSTVEHCSVTDRHDRQPALLEWRHTLAGWQGRVIRPVVEDGDWIVVEERMPAELLDPT